MNRFQKIALLLRDCDAAELRAVNEEVHECFGALQSMLASKFRRGDKVCFKHRGTPVVMKITKVNNKTLSGVVLNEPFKGQPFRASPSICEKM